MIPVIRLLGLAALAVAAFAQPTIVDVTYNDFPYDYRPPEELGVDSPPALAQGSIFKIWGSALGPEDGALTPTADLPSTLDGVEATIESGDGVERPLPLYWAGTAQINAVMLSDAPVGRARLRVSYAGETSEPFAVRIVRARPRMFDWTNFEGPGVAAKLPIVQVAGADGSRRLVTQNAPARPGDVLVLWAYGLGPRSEQSDQVAAPEELPAPVEVFLGDRAVAPRWVGRSGCCAAVDQVQFEIPPDAPLGCDIPLMLRLYGGVASESERLPITAEGESCADAPTPGVPALTGEIFFTRTLLSGEPSDYFHATFLNGELPRTGDAEPGTCGGVGARFRWVEDPLDAGALRVDTPSESFQPIREMFHYRRQDAGRYLGPGSYAVTAEGGADVGPFTATLDVPSPAEPDLAALPSSVGPDDELTVYWTGGEPVDSITIQNGASFSYGDGAAATSGRRLGTVQAVCFPAPGASSFTVPRWLQRAMTWAPAQGELGPNARISNEVDIILNTRTVGSFEAEGLDVGTISYTHSERLGVPYAGPFLPVTPVMTTEGVTVLSEVAVSAFERNRGLAGRVRLDAGRGVLFQQDASQPPSFPVTPIDVDLVWLDADRRVVATRAVAGCETACEPLAGPQQARWSLALHPGEAMRLGLAPGAALDW